MSKTFEQLKPIVSEFNTRSKFVESDVLDIQPSKNKLNWDELVNGYYYGPNRTSGSVSRYWYNPVGYLVRPGEYVYVYRTAGGARRADNTIRSYCLLNTDGTLAQALVEDLTVLNANHYKYHNETENDVLFVANFWKEQGTEFSVYITDKTLDDGYDYMSYIPYSKDSIRLSNIEKNVSEAKEILDHGYSVTDPIGAFLLFAGQRFYVQDGTNKIVATQNSDTSYKCFGVDITGLTGLVYIHSSSANAYRKIYVSAEAKTDAVALGSFNYLNVSSLGVGSLYEDGEDTFVEIDLAKLVNKYPGMKAIYVTVPRDEKYGCYASLNRSTINPLLYGDNSIPNAALKNGDCYVRSVDSELLVVDEVNLTSTAAGTYISKSVYYNLNDLGLSAGDPIFLTIESQDGCLDNNIFSLEAYDGTSRLAQKFVTKTGMETNMVIPEGTSRLCFLYRLCMATSCAAGDTASWSGIKLFYYTTEQGKKIIPPYYYIPGGITEDDLTGLKTNVERSKLFSATIFGNVETAINNVFSTVARKKFLMLAWFSDLHRKPFTGTADAPVANSDEYFYNTVELMKYLRKRLPIQATLDTGDIILGTQPFLSFSAERNFMYEAEYLRSFDEACENYLYAPGNHDGYNANSVNLQDTEYQIGASVLNNRIESKQPGKCYYYLDYPDIKTRLLVLAIPGDSAGLGIGEEQLRWIAETGLGNVPDGYGVILAYHIPTVCISWLEGGNGGFTNRISFEGLINAFHNHTTYTDSVVSADFSGKTGTKIVAALNGHMHFDAVSNPGEIFTQDKGRDGTSKAGESLTNNLPCKQIMIDAAYKGVVDIVIYVPDDGRLYTKRIGMGTDREIIVN